MITGELLKELAAKLYNVKDLAGLFKAEGINLSFWGIGVDIKKADPITDLCTAVEQLSLSADRAAELARMTNGYSLAFQVIGYFTFKNGGDYKASIPEIRQYLEEYVYDKIWSELSRKEAGFRSPSRFSASTYRSIHIRNSEAKTPRSYDRGNYMSYSVYQASAAASRRSWRRRFSTLSPITMRNSPRKIRTGTGHQS